MRLRQGDLQHVSYREKPCLGKKKKKIQTNKQTKEPPKPKLFQCYHNLIGPVLYTIVITNFLLKLFSNFNLV